MEPQYEGISIVEVRGAQSVFGLDGSITAAQYGVSATTINTMVGIAESNTIAENVLKKTNYEEIYKEKELNPEFRGLVKDSIIEILTSPILLFQALGVLKDKPTDYHAKALKHFAEDLLMVEVDTDTQLIILNVAADNPSLSNKLSNAVVDEFLALNTLLVKNKYQVLGNNLKLAYERSKTNLASNDAAINNFKKENNIGNLAESRSKQMENLANLQAKMQDTEQQIEGNRSELSALSAEILTQSPTVSSDTISTTTRSLESDAEIVLLLQQLEQLESLLTEMESDAASNSKINQVQSQIQLAQQALDSRSATIVTESQTSLNNAAFDKLNDQIAQINADILGLLARSRALENQIALIQSELGPLSDLEMEFTNLERAQQLEETEYARLANDIQRIEAFMDHPIPDVDLQVIDRSNLTSASEPSFPKWPLAMVIVLIFSFITSLISVFFINYWSDTFSSQDEIVERYNIPSLGAVERVKRVRK